MERAGSRGRRSAVLGDERLPRGLARASALLLANTGGGRRVTTGRSARAARCGSTDAPASRAGAAVR